MGDQRLLLMLILTACCVAHAYSLHNDSACELLIRKEQQRHLDHLKLITTAFEARLASELQKLRSELETNPHRQELDANVAAPCEGILDSTIEGVGQETSATADHVQNYTHRVGVDRPARSLLQTEEPPKACSMEQVQTVLNGGSDGPAIVGKIMGENMDCGVCIMGCVQKPLPDILDCMFACGHQRENQCDATDMARIASLVPRATVDDRKTLIAMLEKVEERCAYCLLESFESVCGAGCIEKKLKITTGAFPSSPVDHRGMRVTDSWLFRFFDASDYPILPRPCVPGIADAVAASQAQLARAATTDAVPFGVMSELLTELFVPYTERANGAAVYRGLGSAVWLHRCASATTTSETWVTSATDDWRTSDGCEGRVWLDVDTSQARSHLLDLTATARGMHFNFGMERCALVLGKLTVPVFNGDASAEPVMLSFESAASAVEVACLLLWHAGPYSVGSRSRETTIVLPSGIEAIELIGDIVVGEGESFTLQASENADAALILGKFQVRVATGGKLDIVRVKLSNATAGPALHIDGEVTAINSSFVDCMAGTNRVSRYAAGLAPKGSETNPPIAGTYLGVLGSAVTLHGSSSKFISRGCNLERNVARGARVANWGPALASYGGHVILDSTIFKQNAALGGTFSVYGGAMFILFTKLEVDSSYFLANEITAFPETNEVHVCP
jgi:hypothetical protein